MFTNFHKVVIPIFMNVRDFVRELVFDYNGIFHLYRTYIIDSSHYI